MALQIIDEMDWCSPKQALKVARMVQGCPNTDNEVAVKTSLQSAARTASANEEEFVQACWRFLRWYYGDIPENMLMELLPRGDFAALPSTVIKGDGWHEQKGWWYTYFPENKIMAFSQSGCGGTGAGFDKRR